MEVGISIFISERAYPHQALRKQLHTTDHYPYHHYYIGASFDE